MFEAFGTGGATLAPDVESEQPRLGRLLVERGFISEEQLEFALSEHDRSGLPLGQVLIGLSYVTAPTISQALATQHGGLLKTEYGVGTGFDANILAEPGKEAPSLQPAPVAPTRVEVNVAPLRATAIPPAPAPTPAGTAGSAHVAELELPVGAARQDAEIARHDAETARQDAESARRDLDAAKHELAASLAGVDAMRRELEAARGEAAMARGAAEACAIQRQALQDELAMTTENLRNAYARLHQFEIAQALQQQDAASQLQPAPPAQPTPQPQDAQPASPYTWQS